MTDRPNGPPFEQPPDFPPMRVGYGGRIRVKGPDGEVQDIGLGWTTEEVRVDDPELRPAADGERVMPMPKPTETYAEHARDLRQAQFEDIAIRARRIVRGADGSIPEPGGRESLFITHEQGPWFEPDERELIVRLLNAAIRTGGETGRRAAALRKKLRTD